MNLASFETIGGFRHEDYVIIFLDSELGRQFFAASSLLPRASLAQFVMDSVASVNGNLNELNSNGTGGPPEAVIITHMDRTTLPRDLPEDQFLRFTKGNHA